MREQLGPLFSGELVRPSDHTGPGRFLGEFSLEPLVGDEENPQQTLLGFENGGSAFRIGFAVREERTVRFERKSEGGCEDCLSSFFVSSLATLRAVIFQPWSTYGFTQASTSGEKKYGQRWQVETVFSMIKRRLGEATGARTYHSQCRALLLKVVTHNILIVTMIIRVFYRAKKNPFFSEQTIMYAHLTIRPTARRRMEKVGPRPLTIR